MTARRVACVLSLAIALSLGSAARAAEPGPLEIAAFTWLELLDAGRFEDAWRESDPLLRQGIDRASWIAATKGLRDALGPVASREGVDRSYHTALEGAPAGHFFTLRIRTRLAGGGERIEIVTLVGGAEPSYRVAAYGLKR